jgi:hypothetical protein
MRPINTIQNSVVSNTFLFLFIAWALATTVHAQQEGFERGSQLATGFTARVLT